MANAFQENAFQDGAFQEPVISAIVATLDVYDAAQEQMPLPTAAVKQDPTTDFFEITLPERAGRPYGTSRFWGHAKKRRG